jgi:hypothetical protein
MTKAQRPKQESRHLAPSEIADEPWVGASPPTSDARDGRRVGKWLIFTPRDHHDEVWSKIRVATEAGDLGCSAKAATARRNQPTMLTCVYTYDFEDYDDVRRVLAALRALGFGGLLSYKSDEATRARIYGKGTAIYVSQAGSLEFEDRRQPAGAT